MRESSGRNCRVDGKSTCYNRRLREMPSIQSTVLTESAVDRLATRLRPESRIRVGRSPGRSISSQRRRRTWTTSRCRDRRHVS